jgi:hypothetical protein
MTITDTPIKREQEYEVARLYEAVAKLEKMDVLELVEQRDDLAAIRGRLAYLEEVMAARPERVYTMRGPDSCEEEATLEVKPGRAVCFDTGAGTIQAYIAGGCLVVSGAESTGFPLAIRLESGDDVAISLDGWYPLELGPRPTSDL